MHKSLSIDAALRQLLLDELTATQEEICAKLEEQAYDVNQSKVSRMLRKLGAIKSKNKEDQVVYCLPQIPTPQSNKDSLSHLVLHIVENEIVIILHTSPGSASLIARTLDYHREKASILGTVAGDDTILVLPKSIHTIKETLQNIKGLLSLE